MIKVGDKYLRNLEEQVQYLTDYHDVNQGLVQWGIRVIGQVDTVEELDNIDTTNLEYGDAVAVGTESPFFFYIWTRASIEGNPAYWFPFGEINTIGPEGPKGERGPEGPAGESSKWYSGSSIPSMTSSIKDNDYALRTTDGNVYQASTAPDGTRSWVYVGNIQGPRGIQGIQGPIGPQGIQGIQGPAGPQGPVGKSITIIGEVNSVNELPDPNTVGRESGYLVTVDGTKHLYLITGTTELVWTDAGSFGGGSTITVNGAIVNQFNADTKVDKVSTTTTNNQAYVKLANGNQTMWNMENGPVASTICVRDGNGRLRVVDPLNSGDCATKGYVDTNFVAKNTTVSNGVYGKSAGSEIFYEISQGITQNTVARRTDYGGLRCVTQYQNDATTKQFVEDNFVAKQTGTPDSGATRGFLYGLQSDGTTPNLYKVQIQSTADTIPLRNPSGTFYVGTPTLQYEAANKGYVDNKVTGIFALDGTTLTITTA